MPRPPKPPAAKDAAALVLGYANFSSGSFDPAAWRAFSHLYEGLEPADGCGAVTERPDAAAGVAEVLRERLADLEKTEAAFTDSRQARWVLDTTFDELLPAYRAHHADLLEHQPPGALERPFFVMAAIRSLLAEGTPDDPSSVQRAINRLDDYVGWRPLAVLKNGRLSAPYPHERVRPIPLYVGGAGAAHGRYGRLVAGAIQILGEVPAELLRQADFDLAALEELAIDPRAFDFLHPAASRPNYLFGLWDPALIDDQGMYRRMVVQQATLDGILSWPAACPAAEHALGGDAERRWESSAVLAGVMLMASGLSGHGPGSPLAALPLAELLPRIAAYRDEFYRRLLASLPAGHRERLEEEARRMRQPFGGVRRHINAVLAGRRARQVENVALAAALARLGRSSAAEQLVAAVPAASARLLARITDRVVAAQRELWQQADATAALRELDTAAELLLRGVDCGALVDPWNILGLAGQFPLHEASGESLPDPRVGDLVAATESILEGYAATWRHAALDGDGPVAEQAVAALRRLAAWWDRFATTTVSGVPHLSGREVLDSAGEVIAALRRRRQHAGGPPPPSFWRQEVARFTSPRSHAQAAAMLLDEGDLDGAAGLLIHWASLLEGEAVGRNGPAWLTAAMRWTTQACQEQTPAGRARVRRFLELVEANVGGVLDVVDSASRTPGPGGSPATLADDEDTDRADDEERVAAAYESMVWRDSADDGVDGGMIDVEGQGSGTTGDLVAIEDAAEFVRGLLRLYRTAVTVWCGSESSAGVIDEAAERAAVEGWRQSFRRLRRVLIRAAGMVAVRDQEPPPGMPPGEFDRLRWHRDSAAERLVEAAVQASETLWMLAARRAVAAQNVASGSVGGLFACLMRGDADAAADRCQAVCERLVGKPVLYVPLSRGGRPDRIVRARSRERLLERLAACLPRLGLVRQAIAVVQLSKALESLRPRGAASVSEFDRVFEAATTALVERIVESAGDGAADEATRTSRILEGLSLLVPKLLETWMTHARQLRLSVLERMRDDRAFSLTREFIERYGAGLFTQHLLSPSSLRGILRGGVAHWLEQLVDRAEAGGDEGPPAARLPVRLIEYLRAGALPLKQAASRLRLVLESVAENHAEYRDWNSTTTQSDRGDCLHILLDYLRVKAEYDRIAWTLRPVTMAHRVLARRGATAAAESWRERLREETKDTAQGLVKRLEDLEAHWSLRLASVGDRVRRPFSASLEQDELEALVQPAVAELLTGAPAGAGGALEARAAGMIGVASGSGVEVPEWLDRFGQAVDRAIKEAEATPRGVPPTRVPSTLAAAVPLLPMPWPLVIAALGDEAAPR
ncbi:MAG: hypothetical protein ACKO6E_05730 [Planctomycetota bacterium]